MRRIPTTGVGKELAARASTERHISKIRDVFSVSPAYSDGTATMDLKTGKYTYENLQFMIRSAAEIVGDTFAVDGKHYVSTGKLDKYISRVRLEIDGVVERDLPMDLLVKFNEMDGYDVLAGVAWMVFGGPHQFDDKRVEDVYALGTNNVRDLRILVDLTTDWVDGSMFVEGMAEYTSTNRPITHLRTVKSKKESATGAGQFTITGLPIHSDIGAIHVLGDNILSAELIIDDVEVMSIGNYQLLGFNRLYGNDPLALGNGMTFDFMRSKEISKALKSLERADQRKRNADIKIILEMAGAAELTVITDQVGRYAGQ